MFNQLTASNGQRINRKNNLNQFLLNRSEIGQRVPPKELPRNYSCLREQQDRLHILLLDRLAGNPETESISEHIKSRLRSKKIELPSDLSTSAHEHALDVNPQSIRVSAKDGYLSKSHSKPTQRRLIKTQHDELIEQRQSKSTPPYKQALLEIDQLNQNFFRSNKKAWDNQLKCQNCADHSAPIKSINRLNRKNDLERYVDNLQRLHSFKAIDKSLTRKHTPISHLDQPIQMKLPNVSPRKEFEPVKTLTPSPSLYEKNRNFINILTKVKARGQSLLVKLRKFPDYKKINA